ncbi:MAG: sialate O-acetylesterase, partial [bacterium]
MSPFRLALAILVVAASAGTASAQQQSTALRLPRLFADGMVVQRDAAIPVWGWAPPRAAVQVHFRGRSASATSDAHGRWSVKLPAASAGGPFALRIASGSDDIVVRDVLVGDVWIASGQSNMEFAVASAHDAVREIASAHDSLVRQFKVPVSWSDTTLHDVVGGSWAPADPAHVGAFSAVAWFFARDLRKAHDVPIGIINTTWGGSAIETWLSRPAQHLGDNAWRAVMRAQETRGDSIRAALRARLGDLPERDAGWDDGRAPWSSPTLDDTAWSTIPVPSYWEGNGYPDVDGTAWYRTTFTLSDADVRSGLDLTMQAIDDDDITWINGTEVGRTQGYNIPRKYVIPSALLHEGRNSLVVRVTDGGGGGGINAPVMLVRHDGVRAPELDARWKFKLGEVSLKPDGQAINKVPAVTYNAMVAPLLPIRIKGVIWYQGESNANNDAQSLAYRAQFANLISSWRKEWTGGTTRFPFLWVQLPNYGTPDSVPPNTSSWALQRESMQAALSLPSTGQAIAIDVGEPGDIHPKNKQDVGARLALVARRVAYGDSVLASGPRYRSHVVRGDTIVVSFHDTGAGLVHANANDMLGGFTIAGADHQWVRANARIIGNAVHVWSARVRAPIAVRYA